VSMSIVTTSFTTILQLKLLVSLCASRHLHACTCRVYARERERERESERERERDKEIDGQRDRHISQSGQEDISEPPAQTQINIRGYI
jgi:hypothetical protein